MLNKQKIEDNVYFAWRKAQVQALKTERLGVIHVSDLIRPCMRNVIYKKLNPDVSMTTEDVRPLYFGQIVHAHSQLALPQNHEVFLAYDFIHNTLITKEDALKIPQDDPRQLDIIYGSIDDVMEIDGEFYICDKKTTGSIDYFKRHDASANDGHKLQINMYKVLLNKCYGIDAKWGCVLYISSKQTEERDSPAPLAFRLKPEEETWNLMLTNANIIRDAMSQGILPGRTRCYLCDGMCSFATACFVDERTHWR